MQCHDRLAGSGPALHHEHTWLGRTDDLVLLGLDRRHDVAELPGAAGIQRGHQARVSADLGARVGEPAVIAHADVALAEQLVLEREQLAALHHEVAPAHEAHRLATGRAVEGFGHRRAPVHHHRLAVAVGQSEAADVERLHRGVLGDAVDATEDESGIAQLQLLEALDQFLVNCVALEARLERSPRAGLGEFAHPQRVLAALLEARVGPVDVGLLGVVIRMLGGHRRCATCFWGLDRLSAGRVDRPGHLRPHMKPGGPTTHVPTAPSPSPARTFTCLHRHPRVNRLEPHAIPRPSSSPTVRRVSDLPIAGLGVRAAVDRGAGARAHAPGLGR